MGSESAREREVHRYYQVWLQSTYRASASDEDGATKRFHTDGSSLLPSDDKALIAFAQLGCLRLNAKRSLVTLIASSRQYMLAEATKSLSLISDLPEDGEGDELWFGNASIPRSQGLSEAVLDAAPYTLILPNGHKYTTPAVVINDVAQDDRYKDRAYSGNGVSFYCGVPIISKAGHVIGAYTIIDDKPRDGLKAHELVFLHDMAKIVMKHLEIVKNDFARFRGEKMVVGLGNFIQGKESARKQPELVPVSVFNDHLNSITPLAVQDNEIVRQFKGMNITNADPSLLRLSDALQDSELETSAQQPDLGVSSPDSGARKSGRQFSATENSEPVVANQDPAKRVVETTQIDSLVAKTRMEDVFHRAASILRDCMAADGVLFFDAVPTNFTMRSGTSEFERYAGTTEDDRDQSASSEPASHDDYSGESDTSRASNASQSSGCDDNRCKLLGYALDVSAKSTANSGTIDAMQLSEQTLRYFTRRYPKGKVFYYTAEGELTSSESEEPEHAARSSIASTGDRSLDDRMRKRANRRSTRTIARELIKIVPGARNVVWLPLWDFHKQRWLAGTFLWSRRPDRLLTAQDDLAYLKTFGSAIMIQVARIDAQIANDAKSTFIANVSHELRSPLHGILGSVEFLHGSTLDAFQSSMLLNVETCAKTLLDTVEHVLDHAKIDQVSAKVTRRSGTSRRGPLTSDSVDAPLVEDTDVATLVEEAVEAVYAGQTFRGAGGRHKRGVVNNVPPSPPEGKEQIVENLQRSSNKFSGTVRIILRIEKQESWWTRTQPGAIRRIIMNILGNALKYTDQGNIQLSLAVAQTSKHSSSERTLCMCVEDTGRGISAAFLQDHAFTPFSQESPFSPGTGLGLSIVRRLVASLYGRVEIQSKKNIGTSVKIYLPMPILAPSTALADMGPHNILSIIQRRTKDMSLCLLDPRPESHDQSETKNSCDAVQVAIRELAENWFGMHTTIAKNMDGVEADFLVYAEPPPIERLLRHHGHHARQTEIPVIIMATNAFECAVLMSDGVHHLTELGRILEVVSQPCGPQKLAMTFHRCFTRLQTLAISPETTSRAEAISPSVPQVPAVVLSQEGDMAVSDKTSYIHDSESPQVRIEADMVERDIPQSGAVVGGRRSRPNSLDLRIGLGIQTEKRGPVLLVDDNSINLRLLVAFMRRINRSYEVASNGQQAVTAFELASSDPAKSFEHILMDISMPVMDGITATRWIRQIEKKSTHQRRARIITLTGLAAGSTQKEMFDAGADYYMTKPVKFKELMDLLVSENGKD